MPKADEYANTWRVRLKARVESLPYLLHDACFPLRERDVSPAFVRDEFDFDLPPLLALVAIVTVVVLSLLRSLTCGKLSADGICMKVRKTHGATTCRLPGARDYVRLAGGGP